MTPKNLVYFGTPDFSARILESVIKDLSLGIRVVGVVTNPDKPGPSPVAQLASQYQLPVFKPTKLPARNASSIADAGGDDQNLAHLKLLQPDIFLVVSYGKFIPQSWLDIPTIAPLNIHFSLLPKYRGALCISEALKNEDVETGVTLMVIDAALDHGPIISQEKVGIDIDDDNTSLTKKLTQVAIHLLHHQLPLIAANQFTSIPQDETLATYTPSTKTRTRDSTFIPWETIKLAIEGQNASQIHALVRSLNPDPGAWTQILVASSQNQVARKVEMKILKTKTLDTKYLILNTIQLPSKRPISWSQFLNGHPQLKASLETAKIATPAAAN